MKLIIIPYTKKMWRMEKDHITSEFYISATTRITG